MDIIDFEQAWADQEDLEALCSELEGFETSERFVDNAEYGFADILKAYAGYPMSKPVNAVVPHGVYLNPEKMIENELNASVPAVLNYPAFRAKAWESKSDKTVVPSASPFLYALELFRERFEPVPEPRGSIFYPAHTTKGMRTNVEWEEAAEELLSLGDEYQPVTVCIHIRDYSLGLHRVFERAGMKVVSAGNCGDSQFIFRWLHLLSAHSYAISNDIGSPALYATRFGIPVLLLEKLAQHAFADPVMLVLQHMKSEREQAKQARALRGRIADLFKEDAGRRGQPLIETVDYLLGAENLKSPEALRAELESLEGMVDGAGRTFD